MGREFVITTTVNVYENSTDVQAKTVTPEGQRIESELITVPQGGDFAYAAVVAQRDVLHMVFGQGPILDPIFKLAREVATELINAKRLHPTNFNSAHEGWAVIFEELDELWDEVKTNPKKLAGGVEEWLARMRKEAIQVAAMGMRFVRDVCDKDKT